MVVESVAPGDRPVKALDFQGAPRGLPHPPVPARDRLPSDLTVVSPCRQGLLRVDLTHSRARARRSGVGARATCGISRNRSALSATAVVRSATIFQKTRCTTFATIERLSGYDRRLSGHPRRLGLISRPSSALVSAPRHAFATDSACKVGADALDGVALRLVDEVRVALRRADAGMNRAAADQCRLRPPPAAHAREGFGWVTRLDTHPCRHGADISASRRVMLF